MSTFGDFMIHEAVSKDQRTRGLLTQRDLLIEAMRAAAAHLDQPVLHTNTHTDGAANILRADSNAALLVIRAALRHIDAFTALAAAAEGQS